MAERRMFAKTIIDSDAFLDMPLSTQALYFHLSMRADDEGFINNPKKIQRMIGCSEDDLKLLIAKNFIIPFESGIVVIKHWKIHNYIRGDRVHNTQYTEERSLLDVKENGSYTMMSGRCQSVGSQLVGTLDTEVRLGKDSIGKVNNNTNISNDILDSPSEMSDERIKKHQKLIDEWNTLVKYGIKPVRQISGNREVLLNARLRQYGKSSFHEVVENIKQSDFLQGHSKRGWMITFDWLVKPNNYPKVLEGNFADKKQEAEKKDYGDWET